MQSQKLSGHPRSASTASLFIISILGLEKSSFEKGFCFAISSTLASFSMVQTLPAPAFAQAIALYPKPVQTSSTTAPSATPINAALSKGAVVLDVCTGLG